jgi:hypothetical protein
MDIFKSMNSTDRLPWKVQEYVEKFKYNQHLCTNTIELDCVDFTYEVEDLTQYISEDLVVEYETVSDTAS